MIPSKPYVSGHSHPDRSIIQSLLYELKLSYQFMRYDLTATIFPATLLLLAVCFAYVEPRMWLLHIMSSIVYFWLYIYTFNLSNQHVGYEEDCLNKPTRPLPTGMVTLEGTRIRWYIFTLAFLILGLVLGVAEWAVLWTVVVVLHNWMRWSWHWLGKNFLMGVGTFAQLAAAWQIAHPLDAIGWTWVTMMSILIFMVVAVQDLRDLEGDRQVNRRTMPMVFGETVSRWYFSIILLAIPPVILLTVVPATPGIFGLTHFVIMSIMCFVMAIRVVLQRDTHADRVTYDWLTTWYMVVLSLAIWIL